MPKVTTRKKVLKSISKDTSGSSVRTILRRNRRKRRGPAEIEQEPLVVASNYEEKMTELLRGNYLSNSFRYGEYIHVSDILHRCVRMIALSLLYKRTIHGETIYDNSQVTFSIGHALQKTLTDKLIRTQPNNIYGLWKCACGQTETRSTLTKALDQGTCKKCDTSLDNYNEIDLKYEDLKLSGSVDITLWLEDAFYLTECKSIKKDDWSALVRPIPDHIFQIVFYWFIARELNWPIHNRVSIVYIPKEQVRGSPYKEFVIDPEEYLDRLQPYLDDARALNDALNGGALPKKVCSDPSNTMAKRCEMCTLCFNV